jgi:thiosulfate/3-mercaptopyruvate sulfurtransferase
MHSAYGRTAGTVAFSAGSVFRWIVCLCALAPAANSSSQVRPDDTLPFPATVDWLASRMSDPSLVLLHVGEQAEFDAAHIPGARFVSRQELSTPQDSRPILEMPPAGQLQQALESLGISDDSTVVVYFGKDWVSPAARVVLTLHYAGLGARTTLLDGGMPAWRSAGKPVSAERKPHERGRVTLSVRNDVVVDTGWVKSRLAVPDTALVDARTPNFYRGESAGMASRAGHLPGAVNIPFSSVVDDALKLKDRAALEALFAGAGIRPGQTVVTYCHIGQQASLVYLVARHLGYQSRMYDPSFTDWASNPDLPVEK